MYLVSHAGTCISDYHRFRGGVSPALVFSEMKALHKKENRRKIMAKYTDTIDLYSDDGKLLKSGVTLERISPLVNPAIKRIIDLTKRTIAVNLGGMQKGLATGKVGKGSDSGTRTRP